MTSWGPGHIELVSLGPDSAVHQKRLLNGTWSDWASLGGNFVHQPACVSMNPNWLNIFVIGTDGKFYNKWWDGSSWASSWQLLGSDHAGSFMERPVAISVAPGTINIFTIDKSRALWMITWTGKWSSFVSLGGAHLHAPVVVSTGKGKFDIFSVGPDNLVYHKWFDGTNWGPATIDGAWESTGQKVIGEVRAVTRPGDTTGIIDVFGVGWDSAIWYKSGKSGAGFWGPSSNPVFRNLGGVSRGSPSVVSMNAQSLEVFIAGPDSIIYHIFSHDGGATWAEENMGGPAIREAAAVSWDQDHLNLFIITLDGSTMNKAYTPATFWRPSIITYETLGGVSVSSIATK